MALVLIPFNRAGTVEYADEATVAGDVGAGSAAAATAAGRRCLFLLPFFLRFFVFLVGSRLAAISLCASIKACFTFSSLSPALEVTNLAPAQTLSPRTPACDCHEIDPFKAQLKSIEPPLLSLFGPDGTR